MSPHLHPIAHAALALCACACAKTGVRYMPGPTDPPGLVAPAEGACVETARPSFAWTESLYAARYLVTLARDEAPGVPVATLESQVTTGTLATDLAPGRYRWRVRAFGGDVADTVDSAAATFVVTAALPALAVPPTAALVCAAPALAWTDPPAASGTTWDAEVSEDAAFATVARRW